MQRQPGTVGILQVAAITAVLVAAGLMEVLRQTCLTSITNGDFWWHLRVGLGILDTHALPHSGLYSQASALPWIATSWLYDLLVAIGYRVIGLRVVLLTAIMFRLTMAVLLFLLAGGLRGRFLSALLLSAIGQYVLSGLQPLPMYCSVFALCLELLVLLETKRTGSTRHLYILPFLFLLWANLDVQFVYGVIALVLFLASYAIDIWVAHATAQTVERTSASALSQIAIVSAVCAAVTTVTPYGWKPYQAFFSRVASSANRYFPEYQSLRFRTPPDYVLLLLVMAAFLALGMRRSRDLFQIGLLVSGTALAFRAQGNVWVATIVAVAVLANALPDPTPVAARTHARRLLTATALGGAVLLIAMARYGPANDAAVLAKIGAGFPVAAAEQVREQRLPQPLFNTYEWGGFLAWYLPEYPVAIDGRSELYGAAFNVEYAKVMNADAHYSTFSAFNQARTILLERNSLMGKALPSVPGFKVAYADNIAVVLLREQ